MKVMTFHDLPPFEWLAWAAENAVFCQIAETRIGRVEGRWFPILTVLIDPGREVEVMLRWSEFVSESID